MYLSISVIEIRLHLNKEFQFHVNILIYVKQNNEIKNNNLKVIKCTLINMIFIVVSVILNVSILDISF